MTQRDCIFKEDNSKVIFPDESDKLKAMIKQLERENNKLLKENIKLQSTIIALYEECLSIKQNNDDQFDKLSKLFPEFAYGA